MPTADRLDTLTVLFTDLVGSTGMRAALGESAADDLWARIEAIQTDRVTAVGRDRLARVPELFLGSVGPAAGAEAFATAG